MITATLLRFSIQPSFGMPTELRLCKNGFEGADSQLAIEVGLPDNDEAVHPPRVVTLDHATASQLLADFDNLCLPPRPSFLAGLDGTTYTLQFGDWPGSLRLQWWSNLPEEWAALDAPLRRLAELANVSLNS